MTPGEFGSWLFSLGGGLICIWISLTFLANGIAGMLSVMKDSKIEVSIKENETK